MTCCLQERILIPEKILARYMGLASSLPCNMNLFLDQDLRLSFSLYLSDSNNPFLLFPNESDYIVLLHSAINLSAIKTYTQSIQS